MPPNLVKAFSEKLSDYGELVHQNRPGARVTQLLKLTKRKILLEVEGSNSDFNPYKTRTTAGDERLQNKITNS